jgi:hypothetical protein
MISEHLIEVSLDKSRPDFVSHDFWHDTHLYKVIFHIKNYTYKEGAEKYETEEFVQFR